MLPDDYGEQHASRQILSHANLLCFRVHLIRLLQGMFRELGEALDAAEQPGLRHLPPAQLAAAAASVCDTKTAGGETFVRLNEAKVCLGSGCSPASGSSVASCSLLPECVRTAGGRWHVCRGLLCVSWQVFLALAMLRWVS